MTTMYHTSPEEITEIHRSGIAGDCLFFSSRIYVMTAAQKVYIYEADFNCVEVSELHDEKIVNEIAKRFGCDTELAESILNGRESEWSQEFECCSDDSFWLQGKRGECAKKMGFDGCEDRDEQGVVFIIPMFGREKKLRLLEN